MRQIYEGDMQARLRMAQAVRKLNVETGKLTGEENNWLSIDTAGLTAEDNTEEAAFAAVLTDELPEQLHVLLPNNWLQILKMRYEDDLTDEEVGREMGVTRSRISAIEQEAKRLLRQNPDFRKYRSFLK